MIPLYKLQKLPRSQRLRKIAKMVTEAEYRLSLGNDLAPAEIAGLREITALLMTDDQFSPGALDALALSRAALDKAGAALRSGGEPQTAGLIAAVPDKRALVTGGSTVRALNTVRHILLAETGRQTADWDCIDHGGKLDPQKRRTFPGMRVYLEDIRSPYNVGAMFRTAESFGVEKIILSPLCADPLHPRAARTAMGCVSVVPWERVCCEQVRYERLGAEFATERPVTSPLETLKGPFFALETGGTTLADFSFPQKAVMIVGSEELGISPEALKLADGSLGRVTIPTFGAKGSINVSVAFGIVMQAWAAALHHISW